MRKRFKNRLRAAAALIAWWLPFAGITQETTPTEGDQADRSVRDAGDAQQTLPAKEKATKRKTKKKATKKKATKKKASKKKATKKKTTSRKARRQKKRAQRKAARKKTSLRKTAARNRRV